MTSIALAPWRKVALASQFSPSHVCRLPPSHLPRASGEAADVALPSRRPRKHRWAQMRPRVGGGVDLAVFGGRPGEGGRGQGSLGPRRGGEWAGSPPPSPAFCVHFLPLRYADPVSARHPQNLPEPPSPRTPDPSFRRGQKNPRRWSKAGENPWPRRNCKPRKLVEPCSGRNGRTKESGAHVARPTATMPNQGQRVGCKPSHSKAARWHWRMQAVR